MNTNEGTGPYPTQRTAEFTIDFASEATFILADYGPHGEGLFFDPYIRVTGWGQEIYDVGIDDVRTLVAPIPDWKWARRGRSDRLRLSGGDLYWQPEHVHIPHSLVANQHHLRVWGWSCLRRPIAQQREHRSLADNRPIISSKKQNVRPDRFKPVRSETTQNGVMYPCSTRA